MDEIKVLIADDQTLMREGLQTLLELSPGIRVVGQAGDGQETVTLVRKLRPDVVLMDVRMPVMDGVEATRRIRRELPDTQVIILSTFDDDEYIFEGLAAGARGYLLKDVSSEELAEAIHTVHRGQALLPPGIASKVVAEFSRLAARREPSASLYEELTPRELEVLRLLAARATNRQIAEALCITEGTVKNHVSNILGKLGVSNRAQAARHARELGLL